MHDITQHDMTHDEHEGAEQTVGRTEKNQYLVPGAIVLAGLLIAAAVIGTGGSLPQSGVSGSKLLEAQILPITGDDHIRGAEGVGNPRDADVFLVEYSDYRCGYCGRFHATIIQLLEQYGGKVSWVYRHTPYQPGGKEAAVASECIAELAGEEAFWTYTDLALTNQSKLNTDWHITMAAELGADREAFKECLTSDRYDALIASHTANSQEMGGQGTPHNVLLTREGGMIPFPGAQPKEQVEKLIERALSSL